MSQNTHSHPLLCLEGINFSELSNVIDYIYYGELQIYQEDLDRFLQIAQRLQLQGLLTSEEHEEEDDSRPFCVVVIPQLVEGEEVRSDVGSRNHRVTHDVERSGF